MPKARPMTTSRKLMARGLKPIQLWLTQEEHDILARAAQVDGRKMTEVVKHYGLAAARKILENS